MDPEEVDEAPQDVEVDRAPQDQEDKTMVGTYQDKTVAGRDLWTGGEYQYFGVGY